MREKMTPGVEISDPPHRGKKPCVLLLVPHRNRCQFFLSLLRTGNKATELKPPPLGDGRSGPYWITTLFYYT